MSRMRVFLLGFLLFSFPLLVAACGNAQTRPTPTPPVSMQDVEDSAREWLAGLVSRDGNKILKYTCIAQRKTIQDAATMGWPVSMQLEVDASDVTAHAVEYTSDRARIQMGGELRAAMGVEAEALAIGDVWHMLKENDTWRWCGTDSGVIPIIGYDQSATAGSTPTPGVVLVALAKSGQIDPKETVLIPAGEFHMGCSPDDTQCEIDEKPLHTVTLDAYRIDKYEVTNARYKECADAGVCSSPQSAETAAHFIYYGSDLYADYPMVNVDWSQADVFCKWDGGRLPTEAEWEKAARGSDDIRIYPWGNDAPDCSRLNLYDVDKGFCIGDTTAVGSYATGASPYGVMDMSGNAWEWVSDWHHRYYDTSPANDPQGPATGVFRVMRGGKYDTPWDVRASGRGGLVDPSEWNYMSGFRCARSQ